MTMHSKQFFRRVRWRGLILALACGLAAGASMAEGVSQCPADTVPVQIRWGSSIVFSVHDKLFLSDTYPRFRTFVTAVTERIATRLAKDKLCLNSAESKERSLLRFESWTLTDLQNVDRQPVSMPPLEVRPTGGGCRIISPWMDLAFERKPVPWIRGIVRWNERQLLADQAVLDGAKNVPPGVAMPLTTRREFFFFVNRYQESEIFGNPSATPVEERVPPDLLWLFRRSLWARSDGVYFHEYVYASMKTVTDKGADSYAKLAIALIDRCFDADGATFQYNSILDAADLIPLDQYKIDMPPIPRRRRSDPA